MEDYDKEELVDAIYESRWNKKITICDRHGTEVYDCYEKEEIEKWCDCRILELCEKLGFI